MWQRFTKGAKRAILSSQQEAQKRRVPRVDTEHLLLGLLHENDDAGVVILHRMGIKTDVVRAAIEAEDRPQEPVPTEPVPTEPKLTPDAKRVLVLADEESHQMGHSYNGTEHLLLALLRLEEGRASKVLRQLGMELEVTRSEVLKYLEPNTASES